MPDLPIDTLFIVGLLIASFVGKLLEGRAKKKNTTTKTQNSRRKDRETVEEKSLGDILSETFGEVVEQAPSRNVDKSSVEEQKLLKPNQLKTNSLSKSNFTWEPKNEMSHKEEKPEVQPDSTTSSREWLKNEALNSKKSLKRAFLVKEVLDQPPGLKRPGL